MSNQNFKLVSRLAPSPTGALHLGNARTFLANWLIVRSAGGKLQLRMDDLDGPRVKKGADAGVMEDLQWLGLAWDGPVVYQSDNVDAHHAALARLDVDGMLYPDQRRRRDLLGAAAGRVALDNAPLDAGDHRAQTLDPTGPVPTLRFAIPNDPITFVDALLGRRTFEPRAELGDFIVRTREGLPSYQLACVIDDHDALINHVVRGDDLLASTGRQLALHRALDLTPPTYTHLSLVIGADGRKLAKRHGDTRIAAYREAGVSSQRLLGVLARWLGIDVGEETTPGELLEHFELARVPTVPIVYDAANDPLLP
ncbi:MAG: glutamate--tRNA ligase family protein [Planctomycetota bacterium]